MALLRRYDAVFQNPPFGEPVPATKPYLKTAYPWIPTKDYNLLAAFVGRGLKLCRPDVGYVGAITSRAGMFLKTFEAWRKDLLLRHNLVTVADLGYGVMEGAQVEAVAYVLGNSPMELDQQATFIRLLNDTDKPAGLIATIDTHRRHDDDSRIFQIPPHDLHTVPGSPVAYWMSPAIRCLFTDHPAIEGTSGDVRQGLATGDNFRFVRAFWEVDPSSIARSRRETKSGKRWVPFAKGGDYSPYWADIHLVVEYENDGTTLREYHGSVIRNPQYYFRCGLTWPERTTSGFGPRILPTGVVFSHVGHGVFPTIDRGAMLGFLMSRLTNVLLAASLGSAESTRPGSPAKRYSVGSVQRIPWISGLEMDTKYSRLVLEIADLRRHQDVSDETTRLFNSPSIMPELVAGLTIVEGVVEQMIRDGDRHLHILELTKTTDQRLNELASLDDEARAYVNVEVGPHPASYDVGPLDESELHRLLQEPIRKIINGFIERRGGSRAIANKTFFADRQLEVIAHGLERPPSQIESYRREAGILPSGEVARSAAALLSYLVGAAAGRWDLRVAGVREPSLGDLFDPVPIYPPGMLMDGDLPARSTPPGYELGLPPGQLLFDQPGHPWDIVERVLTVAVLLVSDADHLLTDIMKHLKGKDLRDHVRKHFFKDHLKRYTKSRRKAPIYWPLYVPSGRWGVWAYAPSLSRETLYAIEAAATARLNAAEIEISRLRRDQQDGRGGRSPRKLAAVLDTEQRLAEELRVFRNEAERIAQLGWAPDLDDGIVLCAAPLADLFPAWKEAKRERANIKAGEYPWASVTRWADEL